ncbi:MAG TPA: hypothetical protein VLX85_07580 [Stellaceae bacterium]|nr:hypothetical protein [Stellaceae bacterium]
MTAPSSTSAKPLDATELLDLLMRLADLMASETAMLSSGHVRDIAPLQPEKLRLTALYQRAVKEIQGGGIKLPPMLRAQIVAASGRLAQAATENELALRIGRASTRRLLDMVIESIKSRVQPLHRYTARRLTRPPGGTTMAFALDRRM